ncbi:MAG: LamG domain-containing protein, partial [Bacteroidota bacterium]
MKTFFTRAAFLLFFLLPVLTRAQAPGNCLHLDGSNDYLTATVSTLPTGRSSYTIEAWINPSSLTGSHGIAGWGAAGSVNEYNGLMLGMQGDQKVLINYWWDNDLGVVIPDFTGNWAHVAATYDSTTNTRKLYLNGVLIASDQPSGTHAVPSGNFLAGRTGGDEYFNGKLDELRIWTVARTASQISSSMLNAVAPNTSGLVSYYNFDQGIPGGSNNGNTVLFDQISYSNNATLVNFGLTGNTSNWLASYAMTAAPVPLPAGNISSTGFTANWSAPLSGTFTRYLLDVSSDSLFGSFLSGYKGYDAGM